MATNPHRRKPIRTLLAMLVITLGLAGFLLAVNRWGDAQLTPKLGLDLEGGTQMILRPQVRQGEDVNTEELSRAVDIIRKRVDGQGVAEAEVSTLGTNVVVTVPGKISQEQQQALEQSSQMRFRPVLAVLPTGATPTSSNPATLPGGGAPTGTFTGNPATLPGASVGTGSPSAPATESAPAATASTSAARGVVPEALRTAGAPAVGAPAVGAPAVDATTPAAPATTPAAGATASAPAPTPPAGNPFTSAPADPNAAPTWSQAVRDDPKRLAEYATNQAWLTTDVQQAAIALQCPQKDFDPTKEDLTKPQVVCGTPNPQANNQVTEKYVLGPSILTGDALADATSGAETTQQGATTGRWVVNLRMQGGYPTEVYSAVSQLMVALQQPAQPARRRARRPGHLGAVLQ